MNVSSQDEETEKWINNSSHSITGVNSLHLFGNTDNAVTSFSICLPPFVQCQKARTASSSLGENWLTVWICRILVSNRVTLTRQSRRFLNAQDNYWL